MALPRSDLSALRQILLDPLPLCERAGYRRDGLRDGPWSGRYADGTLAVEGSFVRGRRQGVWRRYFPEGKPAVELRFRMGVPDGRLKVWWPEGTPALEASFRDGELDGHVTVWDRQGRLHLRTRRASELS